MIKLNKFIKILLIIFISLILLLVLLRITHTIVKIGDKYHWCFSKNLYIDRTYNINDDDDIKEIVYFKKIENLGIMHANISNLDFLYEINQIETLSILNNKNVRIEDVSPIKSCKNLFYADIYYYNSNNLDVFSECMNLKYLRIGSFDKITDISALKNLDKLGMVNLYNVKCNDYSAFFEMESLYYISINEDALTQNQINELSKKGIKVN